MKKIIYLVLTLLCTFALSAQSNLKTLKEEVLQHDSRERYETRVNPAERGSYRHSIGLVATAATTALMTDSPLGWKFIDELWNQKLQPYDDGYYDGYYNGLLYIFSLLQLSGQYQIVL